MKKLRILLIIFLSIWLISLISSSASKYFGADSEISNDIQALRVSLSELKGDLERVDSSSEGYSEVKAEISIIEGKLDRIIDSEIKKKEWHWGHDGFRPLMVGIMLIGIIITTNEK